MLVFKNKFSSWTLRIYLTAIDTADNDPHKDPYRTEEGDDTVEEVVRTVLHLLWEGERKRFTNLKYNRPSNLRWNTEMRLVRICSETHLCSTGEGYCISVYTSVEEMLPVWWLLVLPVVWPPLRLTVAAEQEQPGEEDTPEWGEGTPGREGNLWRRTGR